VALWLSHGPYFEPEFSTLVRAKNGFGKEFISRQIYIVVEIVVEFFSRLLGHLFCILSNQLEARGTAYASRVFAAQA
jgi:hypothetical protein